MTKLKRKPTIKSLQAEIRRIKADRRLTDDNSKANFRALAEDLKKHLETHMALQIAFSDLQSQHAILVDAYNFAKGKK